MTYFIYHPRCSDGCPSTAAELFCRMLIPCVWAVRPEAPAGLGMASLSGPAADGRASHSSVTARSSEIPAVSGAMPTAPHGPATEGRTPDSTTVITSSDPGAPSSDIPVVSRGGPTAPHSPAADGRTPRSSTASTSPVPSALSSGTPAVSGCPRLPAVPQLTVGHQAAPRPQHLRPQVQ